MINHCRVLVTPPVARFGRPGKRLRATAPRYNPDFFFFFFALAKDGLRGLAKVGLCRLLHLEDFLWTIRRPGRSYDFGLAVERVGGPPPARRLRPARSIRDFRLTARAENLLRWRQ